jgi:hypothetical protein
VHGGRIGLAVIACLASWRAPAAADDDAIGEPQTKVWTHPCRLATGHAGSVRIAEQPRTCGGGGCGTRTTITVHDRDGDRLLSLTSDEGDATGDEIAADVRCPPGFLEVHAGSPPAEVALRLRFDARTRRLRLDGPPPEVDGWKRPPLSGDAAKKRRDLARLLDAVLGGGEGDRPGDGDGSWVFNAVDGVDRRLRDGLWTLVARDQVEAGDWDDAQASLARAEDTGGSDGPMARPPAPGTRRQAAAVRKLLAEARRRTMPVTVADRRRLGTALEPQKLPIDAGGGATLFWRAGELCVIQEETPPRNMRCHAPAAKSWGPAVPIEPPENDGRGLKQVLAVGPHVQRCTGAPEVIMVLPPDAPDDKANPCRDDGGVELGAVLAIVDGGKLLIRGGRRGFTLTRGHAIGRADIDPPAAFALLRQSAGGLLVGDGCCVLSRAARLTRLQGGGAQESWDLRGPPPPGETWTGAPLVSPDQRWVVAQSAKPGGRVTLWLYAVAPAQPAPSP